MYLIRLRLRVAGLIRFAHPTVIYSLRVQDHCGSITEVWGDGPRSPARRPGFLAKTNIYSINYFGRETWVGEVGESGC